ncbi:hypothetical protein N7462_008711 [Penicillium macrosclerotiorum]|uniref:uncharacterized protein n=1 Tax=Penicillium macrosclerotiorum TaxID=303699 RepID=UPI002549AB98|nr:uncharacterized protein N7462_008711 [Penicillium macrosclerotiorum]KAJ5675814.1 hypothetical protein N7462_008711 [Penicillium macrosclerotiorum]
MEFIVGTVLAGIPLVLEAYDRYRKLSEGFDTFRNHSRELTKLDTVMKTQKTLFRANVIKLITEITNDPEKARNLLSESHRENLQKLKLPNVNDSARIDSLREMFSTWNSVLELVLHTATAICLEVESFGASSTAKRFRLCWKKDEVQTSIRELRDFTADFNELTTRIVKELEQIRNTSLHSQGIILPRKTSQMSGLERYRQIQSAAYELYNVFALQWSCARHQRHAASISVIDESTTRNLGKGDRGIKFDVAINCKADLPAGLETPIWLEIKSTDGSHHANSMGKTGHIDIETGNVWTNVMEKLTKNSQPMVVRHAETAQRRVIAKAVPVQSHDVGLASGMSDSSIIPVIQGIADDDWDGDSLSASILNKTNNPPSSDAMIDLKMIKNFCCHIQALEPKCSNTYVGYIQDLGLHRFYLPPPERRPPEQQKSLADIITWVSENELFRDLPRTAVAHIASSLAAAVLQYHSTPWLPDSWQSSQIHFFGVGELSEGTDGISSTTPYFRVEFPEPDEEKGRLMTAVAASQAFTAASTTSASSITTAHAPGTTSVALARNELLFRFAIVLLELGYGQLWPQLRQRALTTLPPQRNTDYHAAEKLAQAPYLRNRMGPKFITIVRKCLGCDFGLGENDLANEQLQGLFLVDVVRELQAIEKGLKELEQHSGK